VSRVEQRGTAGNVKVRPTKTPGIPDIRDDNIVEVLRAIKTTMEVREAHSGDPVDAHVTFRQLKDLGLATDGTTKGSGDGGDIPVSTGGGLGPGSYDPSSDLSIPPAPTNLIVSGGFSVIYLEWSGGYNNPAYTEIWRNTVDDLGTAIMVGTSVGNVYADPVEPDSIYYYWVRFHSRADVVGPYNQLAGTMGHSARDVSADIKALSDFLTNSPLWASLSQRIAQIEADQYILNAGQDAKLTELSQRLGASTGRILELWNVTQNQATDLKLLESRGPGNGNAIYFTPERPDGATPGLVGGLPLNAGDIWYDTDDNNRSYRWSGLAWIEFVTAGAKVYHQPNDPASFNGVNWVDVTGRILREGDLWYDSDSTPTANHPYLWNSVTHTWADIAGGDNSAAIITLEQTKIGYPTLNVNSPKGLAGSVFDNNGNIWNNTPPGDKDYAHSVQFWNESHVDNPGVDSKVTWHIGLPFAQAVKQVGVVSNNYDGSITNTTIEQKFVAMQTVDNSVLAQYTVKIDVNGYVTGFGLAANGPAAAPTSMFIVNADAFAIGPAFPSAVWGPGTIYAINSTVRMVQGGVTHVFQSRQNNNLGHPPTWGATKIEQDQYWVDLSARLPFMALTATQVIDGKTYPPGVWMNTANIATATIEDAMIRTLTANKITTGTLTAAISITTGGYIYGGPLNLGVPVGDPGFGIGFYLGNDGGTYKFFIGDSQTNNLFWDGLHTLRVRGHIEGYSGHIGGISMKYDGTTGTMFAPATIDGNPGSGIGFFLDSNGHCRMGDPNGNEFVWDGANVLIYGPGHKLVFGTGLGQGFDWNSIGNKPTGINNNEITITSTGVLQGAGGGVVTAGGVGAVRVDLANAPGGILNQSVSIVGNADGTITLSGAGAGGTASVPGIGNFRITAGNISTFIKDVAITRAVIGLAAIGAAQIENASITNAKIHDLDVDTLWLHGNAVTVPSVSGYAQDERFGSSSFPSPEYFLFGGNPAAAVLQFVLNDKAEMSLVTFTSEVVQGTGTQGGVFDLACYINIDGVTGTLVAIQHFKIGIINNQPRFSQTAVFPFPDIPANTNITVRISARQIPDGDGKTTATPNNIFGNKVLSITGMKK
jgi:hypothetical protein